MLKIKMLKLTLVTLAVSWIMPLTAEAKDALPISKSPQGAKAYIISPKAGETVTSPVKVVFGLSQMGVAPAGVQYPDSGHHHLVIDANLPPTGQPIPADAQHVHFGKGQTEALVELKPGKHTLQLILGDHLHIPHNPLVASEKIEITVK